MVGCRYLGWRSLVQWFHFASEVLGLMVRLVVVEWRCRRSRGPSSGRGGRRLGLVQRHLGEGSVRGDVGGG